jgi:regulatory protein
VSDDLDRCYAAALRILNYRFNSAMELRRKLASKQFDKQTIDATLVRLRDEKWLDDERFAEAFVRSRIQKRVGRLRIRRELNAAGVDEETAAGALARHVDAEGEREAAVAIAAKRARQLLLRHGPGYLASPQGRNKLTGYLLKQGYDAALVYDVVRECLKGVGSRE